MLDDFSVAEKAYETAKNSSGSALAENEKVLDSVGGKLKQFMATFQVLSTNVFNSEGVKLAIDGLTTILSLFEKITSVAGGLGTIITAIVGVLSAKSPSFKFLPFQKVGEKEVNGETKSVYSNIFQAKHKREELAIEQERKSIEASKKSWNEYINTVDTVLEQKRKIAEADAKNDIKGKNEAEQEYRKAKVASELTRQKLIEDQNNSAYKGLYSVHNIETQVDWDDNSKWGMATEKQIEASHKLRDNLKADAESITKSKEEILNNRSIKVDKTSRRDAARQRNIERQTSFDNIARVNKTLSTQTNSIRVKLTEMANLANVIADLDSGLNQIIQKKNKLTHTKDGTKINKLTSKRKSEINTANIEIGQYETALMSLKNKFNDIKKDVSSLTSGIIKGAEQINQYGYTNYKDEKVEFGNNTKQNAESLKKTINQLDVNNIQTLANGLKDVDIKAKATTKSVNGITVATKKAAGMSGQIKEGFGQVAQSAKNIWDSIGDGAKATMANIGASLAIDAALQIAFKVIDALVVTSAEKIENMEAVINDYNSSMSEITKNTNTVKTLSSEFNSLATGVSDNGKNISLSADQYARYNDIVNELVAINPSLVQGYTTEGQAIVKKNSAIAETIKLQKELAGQATEKYLNSGNEVYDGYLAKVESKTQELKKLTGTMADGAVNFKTQSMRQRYLEELTDKVSTAKDKYGIDSTQYQEATENLREYKTVLSEVDGMQQDMTQYLQTYVSTSSAYGGLGLSDLITDDNIEQFKIGLDEISSDATLSLNEMKSKAEDFTVKFNNILSNTGDFSGSKGIKDEIENLEEAKGMLQDADFSDAAIDEYNKAIESNVEHIQTLADKYKSTAPEIAAALNNIASSYQKYAEDITVAEALKTPEVGLDSARTQWEQHEQIAGLPDYTTAIEGYKKIYDSITGGLNAQGEGSNTFWDGAERILGSKQLEKLDYNIDKVKSKIKSINDSGGFTAGWESSGFLIDKIKDKADEINKIKKGMVKEDGSFDIDPSHYQEVADILGVSRELLVSLVDNGRQFGGLQFKNVSQLENAIRHSNEYAQSLSNSDLGYYSWQQLVEEGREAGLSLKEIHDKKEVLEKSGKIKIIDFTDIKETLTALKDIDGIFNKKNKTYDFDNLVTQMTQMGATTEQIQNVWSKITNNGKKSGMFTTSGVIDTSLDSEAGAQQKITEIQAEINKTTDPTVGAVNETTNELKGISGKIDRLILQRGENVSHGMSNNMETARNAWDNYSKNPNDAQSLQEYTNQLEIIKNKRDEFEKLLSDKSLNLSTDQKNNLKSQIEELDSFLKEMSTKEYEIKAKLKVDKLKDKKKLLETLGVENEKVVKLQAIWDKNGDSKEFEEELKKFPPEVRTALKAIVKNKDKKNIKVVGDKVYELDGKKATCIFSANPADLNKKFKVVNGKIKAVDEATPTPTVKANTGAASALLEKIKTKLKQINKGASFSITGFVADKAMSALSWIQNKISAIKNAVGGGGKSQKEGYSTGTAHGTHGRRRGKNPVYGSAANGLNWQSATPRSSKNKAGRTLVGELGQELVWSTRKGYAYLVGQYSPEVVNLEKGDVVYPADETKRILSGRSTHPIFESKAVGDRDAIDEINRHNKKKKKKKKRPSSSHSSHSNKSSSSKNNGKKGTTKKNKKKASIYENKKDILDHQLEMGYISEKTYYKRLTVLYKKYLKGRKNMGKEIRQSLEDQKAAWNNAYNYEKGLLDHSLTMGQISQATYYKKLAKLGNKYYKKGRKVRKGYGDEWRQHQEEMLDAARNTFEKEQAALDKKLEQGLISLEKYYKQSEALRNKYLNKKGLKDDKNQAKEEAYQNYLDGLDKYLDKRQQTMDDKDLFGAWDKEGDSIAYITQTQKYLENLYKKGHLKQKDFQELWLDLERQKKQEQDALYEKEKEHLNDITDLVEDLIRQEAQDRIDALNKSVDQYQEIINKKKESLDLTQKELSFQEDMADLATKIAKKQAEVDMLSRDTSRAGKAKYNKALEELNELIKEQDKTIRDETISQTQENLDKQGEKYSELVKKQTEKIQEWLDNQKAVLDKVFEEIDNKETNNLLDRLLQYNKKHGDGLEDTVKDYWKDLGGLLKKYGGSIESIDKMLRNKTKDSSTGGKIPTPPKKNSNKGNKGKNTNKNKRNVVVKHSGLQTGFVGDTPTPKQNERFALLTNDELVLNTTDQKRLANQVKISESLIKAYRSNSLLARGIKGVNQPSNVELVNNTNINIEGNVDKDVMKKLESYGDMISDKTLNRIGEALNIKGVSPSQRINVYKR